MIVYQPLCKLNLSENHLLVIAIRIYIKSTVNQKNLQLGRMIAWTIGIVKKMFRCHSKLFVWIQKLQSLGLEGVWIRWTGTMEWNGGMDWTGMVEWNGMERWNDRVRA